MTLMRGPMALRSIFTAYFGSGFNDYLETVRAQWGLTIHELPDVVQFDAYDAYLATEYPVIGMYAVSDSDHKRQDYDPVMAEEFRVQYSIRFFCSVLTPKTVEGKWEEPTFDSTMRLRDDMTTAMRAYLLNHTGLNDPRVQLSEDTINTDYPELLRTKSQADSYVGAGIIACQVEFTESLYRTQIGTANTIEVNPALIDAD